MESIIILFVILSTISYLVIQRSVGKITKTPMFLLWLVLMAPPIIWTGWYLINPNSDSIPAILLFAPLILSPLAYLWLIEIGKPKTNNSDSQSDSSQDKEKIILNKSENVDKSEGEKNGQNQSNPQFNPNLPPKLKVRPINAQEEQALRDCFPWGVYYLQKIDYLPQAILCLGKLMTAPEKAYPKIKANLEKVFNDRYLIIFQETLQGQPFFALVPNPYSKTNPTQQSNEEELIRPQMALGLMLLTFVTTTFMGSQIAGVGVEEIERDLSLILEGLPYSLCLMAILGIHELGHYLLAVYYKVRVTLPYFIPIPFFLGTFGAFISIKSPMPNRKAIFDVALAGPLAGFLVTVPVLVWGLAFSTVVPMPEQTSLLSFGALDPHFSFFFAVLSKLTLGANLEAGKAISLHPAAVAGYIGLIMTALNLVPVGQLDGGHIVHAMFGQGKAFVIGQVTRILVILLAFVRSEFIFWALLLLFMPIADQPALNDVTELDNKRDFFGLIALALLVVILLPVPGTVAQWLNI